MAIRSDKMGQSWILPPDIRDLIPVDHICYLVVAIVNSIESTLIIVVTQLLRNTARESGLSKSTYIIVVTHTQLKRLLYRL